VGLEPTRDFTSADFESAASANSATSAYVYATRLLVCRKRPEPTIGLRLCHLMIVPFRMDRLADGVEVAHGTLNPIAQVRSLVRQPYESPLALRI
jgi:hypothetical protein